MQKILNACKRRVWRCRIRRQARRIHRQALNKARHSYDFIPLYEFDYCRRMLESGRSKGGQS